MSNSSLLEPDHVVFRTLKIRQPDKKIFGDTGSELFRKLGAI